MEPSITFDSFRKAEFHTATAKLAAFGFRDQKLSYMLGRILDKIESESKLVQQQFQKLVKQFAVLNEATGEIAQVNGPGTFQIREEVVEDWKKAVEEFNALPIVFQKKPRLKLEQLEGVGLSPMELNAIAGLLDLPPED